MHLIPLDPRDLLLPQYYFPPAVLTYLVILGVGLLVKSLRARSILYGVSMAILFTVLPIPGESSIGILIVWTMLPASIGGFVTGSIILAIVSYPLSIAFFRLLNSNKDSTEKDRS